MTMTRRQMLSGLAGVGIAGVSAGRASLAKEADGASFPEAKVGDDGLFHQDWFIESFLDLREDLVDAASEGKHFAVIWEQRGCPYCREMHRVNFAKPEIRVYIQENFSILQLDKWGPRKVTDFDGTVLGERELANRWAVNFTPTICFYPNDPKAVTGKSGQQAEVFRMPGYFKPFHFISVFEFVRGKHYEHMEFQRFVQERAEQLRAQGKEIDLW